MNPFIYHGTNDSRFRSKWGKGYHKVITFSVRSNSRIFMLKKHQHKKQSGFHIIICERRNRNTFIKIHYTQKRRTISHIVEDYGDGSYLTTTQKTVKESISDVFDIYDSGMTEIIKSQLCEYANNNKKYKAIRVKENLKRKKRKLDPDNNNDDLLIKKFGYKKAMEYIYHDY
mmetsp:Transcript_37646/g.33268  ORF Transcript_37646/g.33268 Transcript_37646/m.33268 type:complete len:172 (+) Transcript_37646:139-654(+)